MRAVRRMVVSAFEQEVRRVAAQEGVPTPEVVVSERVSGRAATPPSGRLIRLDVHELSCPEPAQRWLAAHEMFHVIAHSRRGPGRWLPWVGAVVLVGLVVVLVWPAWLVGPGLGAIAAVASSVLIMVGGLWWSRRLETEADRYAATDGRLDALDEASLLELLTGGPNVAAWLSSHPRSMTRLPVSVERVPAALRQLEDSVGQEQADLARSGGRRWRRAAAVDVVRALPRDRLAVGRWPATVVVARAALTVPPTQLRPHLRAALVASRRLPARVRVGAAGLILTTALAAGVGPGHDVLAILCGAAAVLLGLHEIRWHGLDRRLARPSQPLPRPSVTQPRRVGESS